MTGSDAVAAVGAAIRERRNALGRTQQDLADAAGTSLMLVSQVERGKKTAEIGKVLRLLEVLGIDIELNAR